MHFHGASSAESITGNLFRKISVQEFTNAPTGVNGWVELKKNRIVSIFQVLSFNHFTLNDIPLSNMM